MSRTQGAPQPQTQTQTAEQRPQDPDFARLMSKNARIGGLYKTLSAANANIEAMLPDFMKGQADRLIRRACITFDKTPDLQNITDEHFRRCVVEAAEMGFAIDGKLCYVVKYKSNYQLQLDYKAVVAVAKRNRSITDLDADVVYARDTFRHGRFDGKNVLEHSFDVTLKDRGDVVAAYCRVFLPDGSWNYEVMTRQQLDATQARAPAKNGPWATDPNEMRKKTVIRRKLKLYQDDPGLMRMLEITGWEDEESDEPAKPSTVGELGAFINSTLAAKSGHHEQLSAGEIATQEQQEETHGTQQTAEGVDADLLDLARMNIAAATDEPGVDYEASQVLAKATTDAERTAIASMVHDRKSALRGGQGGKRTQKQLAT